MGEGRARLQQMESNSQHGTPPVNRIIEGTPQGRSGRALYTHRPSLQGTLWLWRWRTGQRVFTPSHAISWARTSPWTDTGSRCAFARDAPGCIANERSRPHADAQDESEREIQKQHSNP